MRNPESTEQLHLDFDPEKQDELTYERFLELVRADRQELEPRQEGHLATYITKEEGTNRLLFGRWVSSDKGGFRRTPLEEDEQRLVDEFYQRYEEEQNPVSEEVVDEDEPIGLREDGTAVFRPSEDHKYKGPFRT